MSFQDATARTRALSLLLAGGCLALGIPAAAQEAKPAEPAAKSGAFSFRLDPLVIEVLNVDLDTSSSKFNEYRDIRSGFNLPQLHITGESADGERLLDFHAAHVGRDDARYTLTYGTPGRFQLLFDHNKIVHNFGNDGRMLWTVTGPGRLEISNSVQTAIQNAISQQAASNPALLTFPFLNNVLAPYLATAQRVDLGLRRDRSRVRLDYGQMGKLAWALEVTHEKRTGDRPFGASFGFSNATEVPEPIDYDTNGADLSGEWTGETSGLRFGYRTSRFENNVSTLLWDNPFRATDSTDPNAYTAPGAGSINGPSHGLADLAPDNRSNLVYVNGRTKFGADSWAQASASYNRMTQDDPLLPYTANTAIRGISASGATFDATNPGNLPVSHADTRVDTLNANGDAGTRLGKSVGLTLRYRYYDYDDKSPRVSFPGYVRFDAVWEPIGRITVPYAFKRQDLGAELTWDANHENHFVFSFNHRLLDRKFQEVEKSDENIYKIAYDSQPVKGLSIRASFERADRNIDGYDVEAGEDSFLVAGTPTNLPDLRKFSQAARKSDNLSVMLQWLPAEAWNVSAGYSKRKENYDESLFGLIDDDIWQWNGEVGYTPHENLDLYLFGQHSNRESFQRARQSGAAPSVNPADNWNATFDELNDLVGLGLTAKLQKLWTLDVSGRYSKSNGKADLVSPPGGSPDRATGFNNYEDIKLAAFLAQLDYQVTPAASVGLTYRYEDYTIDSFIRQGLAFYLPGSLLLNANSGDYKANVYGLRFKLTF
jgi:MtrB/PioB family decaheme-associated outer membrane protein